MSIGAAGWRSRAVCGRRRSVAGWPVNAGGRCAAPFASFSPPQQASVSRSVSDGRAPNIRR
ncbi:Uncharacterised protein [Burkholderia pseudomallei]|nr:Uncharacterised protein [Burkholderia pseudomallei]CAJ5307525.1 Uncharacterised protein [Burkholderia pseudomallei]CAJ5988446.1 Uncharacterised protein [Burkholderia pseudomallei]CAJ7426573.1 Uncharacterised protein [Burkholderia pseudomallei]CAJ9217018.1 Uncharacterised protein [Burkholderia pseudomallei]